jgi:hypothetical protein
MGTPLLSLLLFYFSHLLFSISVVRPPIRIWVFIGFGVAFVI